MISHELSDYTAEALSKRCSTDLADRDLDGEEQFGGVWEVLAARANVIRSDQEEG